MKFVNKNAKLYKQPNVPYYELKICLDCEIDGEPNWFEFLFSINKGGENSDWRLIKLIRKAGKRPSRVVMDWLFQEMEGTFEKVDWENFYILRKPTYADTLLLTSGYKGVIDEKYF